MITDDYHDPLAKGADISSTTTWTFSEATFPTYGRKFARASNLSSKASRSKI